MAVYPEVCGSGEDMKVDGKVGIGTTSPSKKLEIVGDTLVKGDDGWNSSGDEAIMHMGDNNHYIKAVWGSGLRIGTAGAADTINIEENSGNVGIGTTSPGEKLEVNGSAKIGDGAYNGGHLIMGNYHFWVDTSGRLRVKSGAPTSATDGTVVGTQS